MVQIENLTFGYRKNNTLFKELNLQLKPGNIYGLLGKNGAGKTTLLKIVAGLVFRGSGNCSVEGFNSEKRIPEMLENIYVLPEEYSLPPLKIKKYVALNAPFYPRFDHDQMKALLDEFKLDENNRLNQMSYGQKKKFLLAFGLSTNAKLLLMDEPTNGLDIPSKSQFRKVVASSFTDEKILVISTHQVRDLESLIDPIIIIDEGKIIFNQTVESITNRLTFETMSKVDEAKPPLYAEEIFGGQAAIMRNETGRDTRLDLELLFNGVISNHTLINKEFEN